MKTMKTKKTFERDRPRWFYDCGGCAFSWNCGPSCQCFNFERKSKEFKADWTSQWHNIRITNPNIKIWTFEEDGGNYDCSIGEIKSKKHTLDFGEHEYFKVGEEVVFRVGCRNEDGIMTPQTEWVTGIITKKTNKFEGTTWGFYVYSIELIENLKKV